MARREQNALTERAPHEGLQFLKELQKSTAFGASRRRFEEHQRARLIDA
jgi:hypothetical protein